MRLVQDKQTCDAVRYQKQIKFNFFLSLFGLEQGLKKNLYGASKNNISGSKKIFKKTKRKLNEFGCKLQAMRLVHSQAEMRCCAVSKTNYFFFESFRPFEKLNAVVR